MKKLLTGLLVTAGLLSFSLFIKTDSVSAHGYVQSPPARGYQGQLDYQNLGWTDAF